MAWWTAKAGMFDPGGEVIAAESGIGLFGIRVPAAKMRGLAALGSREQNMAGVRHVCLAAALAAIGLTAGTTGTAGAANQAGTPSLSIAPTSGPAGTVVHVSGTGCPSSEWDQTASWNLHVQIGAAGSTPAPAQTVAPTGPPFTAQIGFPAIGYPGAASVSAVPAADGSWTADVTVPEAGPYAAPAGHYPISVVCFATEGAEAGYIVYPSQIFTVTAATPPAPQPAPPTPVVAAPNVTG